MQHSPVHDVTDVTDNGRTPSREYAPDDLRPGVYGSIIVGGV